MNTTTTKKLVAFIIIMVFANLYVNAQITCNGNKICVRKCTNMIFNVCTQYQYKCINPNQQCTQEQKGWIVCSGIPCYSGHQGGRMSETGYNETAIDDIYPNPASTTATVSFSLFKKQSISLKIVDVNGRLVTTIANGEFEEGSYDMNWDVSAVEAGIYFIQFESENISETKKLIVVK